VNGFAIEVEGLGKRFTLGQKRGSARHLRGLLEGAVRVPFRRLKAGPEQHQPRYVWALKDVSFRLRPGEVLGLLGNNGAGKSVLLKVLARITKPTRGYARVRGHIGAMLEVGAGFHPELTGRENIYLSGTILGMNRAGISRQFDEIVSFSGVEQFLHTPIKHYSSGMRVRLAFAIAVQLDTQILLLDEVLSVADDAFRELCIAKLKQAAEAGKSIMLVSHDLSLITRLCHRALLLKSGSIMMDDAAPCVMRSYLAGNSTPGDAPRKFTDDPSLLLNEHGESRRT
jgi:lipopolysaccharide transport system ATP-binding protein